MPEANSGNIDWSKESSPPIGAVSDPYEECRLLLVAYFEKHSPVNHRFLVYSLLRLILKDSEEFTKKELKKIAIGGEFQKFLLAWGPEAKRIVSTSLMQSSFFFSLSKEDQDELIHGWFRTTPLLGQIEFSFKRMAKSSEVQFEEIGAPVTVLDTKALTPLNYYVTAEFFNTITRTALKLDSSGRQQELYHLIELGVAFGFFDDEQQAKHYRGILTPYLHSAPPHLQELLIDKIDSKPLKGLKHHQSSNTQYLRNYKNWQEIQSKKLGVKQDRHGDINLSVDEQSRLLAMATYESSRTKLLNSAKTSLLLCVNQADVKSFESGQLKDLITLQQTRLLCDFFSSAKNYKDLIQSQDFSLLALYCRQKIQHSGQKSLENKKLARNLNNSFSFVLDSDDEGLKSLTLLLTLCETGIALYGMPEGGAYDITTIEKWKSYLSGKIVTYHDNYFTLPKDPAIDASKAWDEQAFTQIQKDARERMDNRPFESGFISSTHPEYKQLIYEREQFILDMEEEAKKQGFTFTDHHPFLKTLYEYASVTSVTATLAVVCLSTLFNIGYGFSAGESSKSFELFLSSFVPALLLSLSTLALSKKEFITNLSIPFPEKNLATALPSMIENARQRRIKAQKSAAKYLSVYLFALLSISMMPTAGYLEREHNVIPDIPFPTIQLPNFFGGEEEVASSTAEYGESILPGNSEELANLNRENYRFSIEVPNGLYSPTFLIGQTCEIPSDPQSREGCFVRDQGGYVDQIITRDALLNATTPEEFSTLRQQMLDQNLMIITSEHGRDFLEYPVGYELDTIITLNAQENTEFRYNPFGGISRSGGPIIFAVAFRPLAHPDMIAPGQIPQLVHPNVIPDAELTTEFAGRDRLLSLIQMSARNQSLGVSPRVAIDQVREQILQYGITYDFTDFNANLYPTNSSLYGNMLLEPSLICNQTANLEYVALREGGYSRIAVIRGYANYMFRGSGGADRDGHQIIMYFDQDAGAWFAHDGTLPSLAQLDELGISNSQEIRSQINTTARAYEESLTSTVTASPPPTETPLPTETPFPTLTFTSTPTLTSTPLPTQEQAPQPEDPVVYGTFTATSRVNVRQDSHTSSVAIDIIDVGEQLDIISQDLIEENGYHWVHVRLPSGEIGYVAQEVGTVTWNEVEEIIPPTSTQIPTGTPLPTLEPATQESFPSPTATFIPTQTLVPSETQTELTPTAENTPETQPEDPESPLNPLLPIGGAVAIGISLASMLYMRSRRKHTPAQTALSDALKSVSSSPQSNRNDVNRRGEMVEDEELKAQRLELHKRRERVLPVVTKYLLLLLDFYKTEDEVKNFFGSWEKFSYQLATELANEIVTPGYKQKFVLDAEFSGRLKRTQQLLLRSPDQTVEHIPLPEIFDSKEVLSRLKNGLDLVLTYMYDNPLANQSEDLREAYRLLYLFENVIGETLQQYKREV